MEGNYYFQVRVTGILLDDSNQLLIVKQKISEDRLWSLPGGRLQHGETIQEGIIREMFEETGLETSIIKLLYVCENQEAKPPLIHISFLLRRNAGEITLPTNEYDENPIHDVKMVNINQLTEYGFSTTFVNLLNKGFPHSGSYMGHKRNIGL